MPQRNRTKESSLPSPAGDRTDRKATLGGRVAVALGTVICGLAAALASLLAGTHSWRSFVPLVFTALLLLVAVTFGSRAGILGTALAAVVFAVLLFQPLGRLRVADDVARTNLGWMLLIGMGFSLLFAPSTSGFRRH